VDGLQNPVLDSAVGPPIPPESNADHEANPSFFFWTANEHTDAARLSAAAPADRSQPGSLETPNAAALADRSQRCRSIKVAGSRKTAPVQPH